MGINFPWLGRLTACTLLRGLDCYVVGNFSGSPAAPQTFSMVNAYNVPNFLVHFDHQVRLFRVEIFDASSGKSWHRAFNFTFFASNSSTTGFFAFPWDGTTTGGNKVYTLPDGNYVAEFSILKALGDANNPANWEYWTSPVITIDRP